MHFEKTDILKDGRTVSYSFDTNDKVLEQFKRQHDKDFNFCSWRNNILFHNNDTVAVFKLIKLKPIFFRRYPDLLKELSVKSFKNKERILVLAKTVDSYNRFINLLSEGTKRNDIKLFCRIVNNYEDVRGISVSHFFRVDNCQLPDNLGWQAIIRIEHKHQIKLREMDTH